jgi:hypothetical protein
MVAKIILCAVVVFGSLISSGVRGAPIDISAGNPGSLSPNAAAATVLTFDDLPLGSLPYYEFAGGTLTGDGAIEDASLPGEFAQPAGDPTRYLTVSYPSLAGSVLFAFSTAQNFFGLYWGSMDSYNSVTFLNGGVRIASFSGASVAGLTGLVANGDQQSPLSNRYINFYFNDSSFDEVVLSTTNLGFEVDNIAFADPTPAIPEPGTLGLVISFTCLVFLLRICGCMATIGSAARRYGSGLAVGLRGPSRRQSS